MVSAVSVYDPEKKGFIVTFTIEEGDRYRFGKVEVLSNVAVVDPKGLYSRLRASPGGVYNAEAVEKSVEQMSIEVARRGYPFAVVRPRGDRDLATRTINVTFTVEDGPRVYIERINIRGNTRTRDYVIRREFDVGEGDAYNRALIDRAERRLKNLNYFKSVKIGNEPGSAPDRIVLNVDVEEQPTGEFSVAGGYSTADGFMAEMSVAERNLLGQGQFARFAVQYGERARGFELSFAEPYFMGYRLGVGIDLYAKQTLASNYISYDSETVGMALRAGFAISEELSFQARYNIYQQKITLPDNLNNCQTIGIAQAVPGRTRKRSATATAKPSLAVRTRTGLRRGAGFHAGLHRRLQHARQQPQPDQRPVCRVQAGLRRHRRRRELHPFDRRGAHLLRAVRRRGRGVQAPGRPSSQAGAARTCACWIISRWAPTWSAASRRPASARAT